VSEGKKRVSSPILSTAFSTSWKSQTMPGSDSVRKVCFLVLAKHVATVESVQLHFGAGRCGQLAAVHLMCLATVWQPLQDMYVVVQANSMEKHSKNSFHNKCGRHTSAALIILIATDEFYILQNNYKLRQQKNIFLSISFFHKICRRRKKHYLSIYQSNQHQRVMKFHW